MDYSTEIRRCIQVEKEEGVVLEYDPLIIIHYMYQCTVYCTVHMYCNVNLYMNTVVYLFR